jgi:uncharacterized protein with HEPN domain
MSERDILLLLEDMLQASQKIKIYIQKILTLKFSAMTTKLLMQLSGILR